MWLRSITGRASSPFPRHRWRACGHVVSVAATLAYARPGDIVIVIVTAIDPLGRSVAEVTSTIAELGERGIVLRALREGVDTLVRGWRSPSARRYPPQMNTVWAVAFDDDVTGGLRGVGELVVGIGQDQGHVPAGQLDWLCAVEGEPARPGGDDVKAGRPGGRKRCTNGPRGSRASGIAMAYKPLRNTITPMTTDGPGR
jgi:hypothetical protein